MYPIHMFVLPYPDGPRFMCEQIGELEPIQCLLPEQLGRKVARAVYLNATQAKDQTIRSQALSLFTLAVRQPGVVAASIFIFHKLPPVLPKTESMTPNLLSFEEVQEMVKGFVDEMECHAMLA